MRKCVGGGRHVLDCQPDKEIVCVCVCVCVCVSVCVRVLSVLGGSGPPAHTALFAASAAQRLAPRVMDGNRIHNALVSRPAVCIEMRRAVVWSRLLCSLLGEKGNEGIDMRTIDFLVRYGETTTPDKRTLWVRLTRLALASWSTIRQFQLLN